MPDFSENTHTEVHLHNEEREITSSSLDSRARRLVLIVALLNLAGCLVEGALGVHAGSASLLADAADFLEDFLINALVVAALGWSVSSRRKASYGLAALILIPAVAAISMAVLHLIRQEQPEPITMSATATCAMVLNVVCATILIRLRDRDSALTTGAWLAARNDVLANVLVLAAGVVTLVYPAVWPDVACGLVIGFINLTAAKEVFEQARAEDPEVEMD